MTPEQAHQMIELMSKLVAANEETAEALRSIDVELVDINTSLTSMITHFEDYCDKGGAA